MPEEDLDDTVIVPSRSVRTAIPEPHLDSGAENTIIVARPGPATGNPSPSAELRRPGMVAEPVATDAPQTPPVYRMRVGNGDPIPLNAPAYIGRKPSAPRISSGARPLLVAVPSPKREVSSTHVEVRQHGASVIVTDLGSTNGTVVSTPGSAPLRLRQGESVVVIPGTVVDIGDGNRIDILSTLRLNS